MDDSEKLDKVKSWLGAGSINIFGPPFAGKDTQGTRLAQELDAVLLSGGAILRGSNMPSHVKELMRAGELIPTNEYFDLVLPYFKQEKFINKPLVLSSVGRWHGEEAGVLESTSAAGHPIMAVIYLNIDDSVVWNRWEHSDSIRLTANRADDTYESLQVRLEEFRDKTMPVIEFYRSQDLLIEMDSDQPTDTVTKAIIDSLVEFMDKESGLNPR